jgi:acyl dehydratase
MLTVSFAELPALAGREIGVSDWLTIDQARIDRFAEATGDRQWIHVDPERAAREMPGGKTIAHGYLTLALIPALIQELLKIEGLKRGLNYGADKVRFTNMVPEGSRVRARQKILSVECKGGGLKLVSEITIEIEGEKRPACVAETIAIIYDM